MVSENIDDDGAFFAADEQLGRSVHGLAVHRSGRRCESSCLT
jgi:hypothetical protein